MKHKAFFIFMTALFIGSPLYAQKYKIALIHSYQEGYSGAGIVNKLFVKGLKDQQIDFQLRTFYLDCEKYESVEEERRISEFADSIRSWGGDLIAVLDDQATYSVMACGNPYVRQVPRRIQRSELSQPRVAGTISQHYGLHRQTRLPHHLPDDRTYHGQSPHPHPERADRA